MNGIIEIPQKNKVLFTCALLRVLFNIVANCPF